jgi:anti-sigma-K factor RskA
MPFSRLKAADSWAFDYVTGNLRGPKRWLFQQWLVRSKNLQWHVNFWQEQLLPLNFTGQERIPEPDVWQVISQKISPKPVRTRLLEWPSAITGTLVGGLLMAALLLPLWPAPAPDYLAVLSAVQTNASSPREQTNAVWLTAKSYSVSSNSDVQRLTLEWHQAQPNNTVEIWAQSKRDGQLRSIAVLEPNANRSPIELDSARWRLITDAAHLVLSLEEPGGSAIGEPSDVILAKGPCIRLNESTL